MLELNPEIVCFLINKAREFHAQDSVVVDDERQSTVDEVVDELNADFASDPAFLEFKTSIDDLEPDQQQAVVALLWLGRGDFSVDEWGAALEEARANWNTRTAEYLLAHPLLADYLAEGLVLHGHGCD